MPSIPSTHLSKIHILSLPTHTHFLYQINHIMCKVLSVLVSINVQAKSDINLGGQGMVITNQGGGYPTVFSCRQNICNFYKTGHWFVFIRTRTETCIKGWDWTCRLQSLLGCPVLRARGRGTGPRSPAHSTARWRVLLRSLHDLQRIQASTQSKHRKQRFVVELETRTHKIWGMERYFWVCF